MIRLFILLSAFAFHGAFAQDFVGTDFWFTSTPGATFNPPEVWNLSIEAVEDAEVTYTLGQEGDAWYTQINYSLAAGDVEGIVINNAGGFPGQFNTGTIHISSTGGLRVFLVNQRMYYSDGSVIWPTSALSDDYIHSIYYPQTAAVTPFITGPNYASIVATEDNTTVNIIPSVPNDLSPDGSPVTVQLNQGQCVVMGTVFGTVADLTGTRITAEDGKKIAVFSGIRFTQAPVQDCFADNFMFEQLPPLYSWGTVHSAVPVLDNGGDLFRIIAKEDNTHVYNGCETLMVLDAGQHGDIKLSEPAILTSTAPVLISAIVFSQECAELDAGDPNLRFLLPLNRGNTSVKLKIATGFFAEFGFIDVTYVEMVFLHLVMPTAHTAELLLNGAPVTEWQPFDGEPGFSVAQVLLPGLTDELEISSLQPFWSEFVGLATFDAITFSMGASAEMALPPIENLNVNLGASQSICSGDSILLDPGLGIVGTWQDGTSQETYLVTEPGIYTVSIAGVCNEGTSSVEITAGAIAEADMPASYGLCPGGEIEIGVSAQVEVNYLWNTGQTNAMISVGDTGAYVLEATSVDGCISVLETSVIDAPAPVVLIEGPESLCPGDTAVLIAQVNGFDGVFTWADGSIATQFTTDSAGTYQVEFLSSPDACAASAEATIVMNQIPEIELFGDFSICPGEQTLITAIASEEGDMFTWSTGQSGNEILIDTPGEYSIDFTGVSGCTGTESFQVGGATVPIILASDTSLCPGFPILLTFLSPNGSLFWPNVSDSATALIEQPGVYFLEAVNGCGSSFDEVNVVERICECDVAVPNIFTPNGDGFNDSLIPDIQCDVQNYNIAIYNRWGTVVFEGSGPGQHWNGYSSSDAGTRAPEGVYFYTISFSDPLAAEAVQRLITGEVTLTW